MPRDELDYVGLMESARKEAAEIAETLYPPGKMRDKVAGKLRMEFYRQRTKPPARQSLMRS